MTDELTQGIKDAQAKFDAGMAQKGTHRRTRCSPN